MGARRSYDERIDELKKRREQLRQQEKALMARYIAQERREQTRRWHRIGREIEEAVGHAVEDDDRELIIESIKELFAEHSKDDSQDSIPKKDSADCVTENGTVEADSEIDETKYGIDGDAADGWIFTATPKDISREQNRFHLENE